ncbi:hypothetical protein BGW38_010326 [Lunasporangiospora selenospora]|uniref:F-box domain-containing protein n=1 Tax=Lunasporangiospora selenospora TaxID=979761 RepID=A0A9P6FXS3_9FUNG|nr:hypothetical protein BGW38_010326 [Lunasporangiospora selenospora]
MSPPSISIFDIPMIIDAIALHLSVTDISSCRLVCSAWADLFEPHRWRYVRYRGAHATSTSNSRSSLRSGRSHDDLAQRRLAIHANQKKIWTLDIDLTEDASPFMQGLWTPTKESSQPYSGRLQELICRGHLQGECIDSGPDQALISSQEVGQDIESNGEANQKDSERIITNKNAEQEPGAVFEKHRPRSALSLIGLNRGLQRFELRSFHESTTVHALYSRANLFALASHPTLTTLELHLWHGFRQRIFAAVLQSLPVTLQDFMIEIQWFMGRRVRTTNSMAESLGFTDSSGCSIGNGASHSGCVGSDRDRRGGPIQLSAATIAAIAAETRGTGARLLTSLRRFEFSGDSLGCDEDFLVLFLRRCPGLVDLKIPSIFYEQSAADLMETLTTTCRQLKRLHLHTDDALATAAPGGSEALYFSFLTQSLTHLWIDVQTDTEDQVVPTILQHAAETIEVISLMNACWIPSQSIVGLLRQCRRLKQLLIKDHWQDMRPTSAVELVDLVECEWVCDQLEDLAIAIVDSSEAQWEDEDGLEEEEQEQEAMDQCPTFCHENISTNSTMYTEQELAREEAYYFGDPSDEMAWGTLDSERYYSSSSMTGPNSRHRKPSARYERRQREIAQRILQLHQKLVPLQKLDRPHFYWFSPEFDIPLETGLAYLDNQLVEYELEWLGLGWAPSELGTMEG